jgi:hypothetical protein
VVGVRELTLHANCPSPSLGTSGSWRIGSELRVAHRLVIGRIGQKRFGRVFQSPAAGGVLLTSVSIDDRRIISDCCAW